VPYIVDVNATPLFSEYSSSSLVQARTAGVEQMGANALFAAMPRTGEPAYERIGRWSISSTTEMREEEGL
jgi:hypothetical protein